MCPTMLHHRNDDTGSCTLTVRYGSTGEARMLVVPNPNRAASIAAPIHPLATRR